jgi:LuxR family maltose regulon positive regulatory protein
MSFQLLQTKLYIQPPRPNLVPRPRLVRRLEEGLNLGHRLVLVSAPAGFGKTTLLSAGLRLGHRLSSLNPPRRLLAFSTIC